MPTKLSQIVGMGELIVDESGQTGIGEAILGIVGFLTAVGGVLAVLLKSLVDHPLLAFAFSLGILGLDSKSNFIGSIVSVLFGYAKIPFKPSSFQLLVLLFVIPVAIYALSRSRQPQK